ncbi:hypothetical protein F3J19_06630 [Burkholderia sp. Ax-1724]|nr:hypothetical protein [Burkholderia sp. Ax-1724]
MQRALANVDIHRFEPRAGRIVGEQVERAVVSRRAAQLREALCRARRARQLVFGFGGDGALPLLLRSSAPGLGLRGCY